MKKIAVIGGNGYLGSVICNHLLDKKYDVTIFDNNLYKDCNIVKRKNKISEVLIEAKNINSSHLKNFDACIFLSALSNNPIDNLNPKKIYDKTRNYTLKIAKICKKKNINFIFPSSCSVYGKNDKKIVNEHSRVNPLTFYSKNKSEIENDLLKLSNKRFNPIIFRIATVVGFSEMMRFDLYINMFVGMLITNNEIILNSDGQAWRPNVDIRDVARAFEGALKVKNKRPLILNLGRDDNTFKIISVARLLKRKFKKSKIVSLHDNKTFTNIKDDLIKNNKDKRSYRVSFSKIKKYKNLYPRYNFKQSINNLIKDLKKTKLSKKKFNSNKFYRLQRLKYLIEKKKYKI